jgi:pyrroline-5-carboxylate reductase
VISVMAGVSSRTLARRSSSERIIRTMPNAAVEIGCSFTPWFAADGATSTDREFTSQLFASCGTAMQVNSESDFDYLTALSGSGPASPALLADAMLTHAVAHGLDPDLARRAVEGVVCDASRLLANQATTLAGTVRTFLGGTTAAGLRAMMEGGFSDAVHAGLTAANAANKMSFDGDSADQNVRCRSCPREPMSRSVRLMRRNGPSSSWERHDD